MIMHTKEDIEWLLELLGQSRFISINDGLGTFVHRAKKGWRICGRDDVISLLLGGDMWYDDLSYALVVAKSLKRRFLKETKPVKTCSCCFKE